MRLIDSPSGMQRLARSLPRPLAFVPTMGALHYGHLALVTRAKQVAGIGGTTAASIFVNPTQFGPNEDYTRYPRTFARDCEHLGELGCDVVFAPTAADMYSPDASILVHENVLSRTLCGASRPGHFNGVCTVVTKLFNLVQPDYAVFGQKDFQQLVIVRRLVRDLNLPVEIIGAPTVREPDGLAMSSRNAYLSAEERAQAPVLHRALTAGADRVRENKVADVEALRESMRVAMGEATRAQVDYVAVVDPDTLQPKTDLAKPVLLAAAVYFGRTRLIDNALIQ